MSRRSRDIPPEIEREIRAFVTAFLLPEQRDRYLSKIDRFYEDRYHNLPGKLAPECVVDVPTSISANFLIEFVKTTVTSHRCIYIGGCSILDEGESSMEDAVAAVDFYGESVASIKSGSVAFYKAEVYGRYFLTRSPGLRQRLLTAIQQVQVVAASTKARRNRRGSR